MLGLGTGPAPGGVAAGTGVWPTTTGPMLPGSGVALDPGGGLVDVADEDGTPVGGLAAGSDGGGDAGAGEPELEPGLVPGPAPPDPVVDGAGAVGAIATPDAPAAKPGVWLPSPPTARAATARTRFITPRARTRRARWAVVTALRALPWSGGQAPVA